MIWRVRLDNWFFSQASANDFLKWNCYLKKINAEPRASRHAVARANLQTYYSYETDDILCPKYSERQWLI